MAPAGDARLPTKTSPRDLVAAAARVESTDLIRMWDEFETALRSDRRRITGDPEDQIGTRNLIDGATGIKQGRAISADVRDDVPEVREYRNHLVHERDDRAPPAGVAIGEARNALNTFALPADPVVSNGHARRSVVSVGDGIGLTTLRVTVRRWSLIRLVRGGPSVRRSIRRKREVDRNLLPTTDPAAVREYHGRRCAVGSAWDSRSTRSHADW